MNSVIKNKELLKSIIKIAYWYYLPGIREQILVDKQVLIWLSKNREHVCRLEKKFQEKCDHLEQPTMAAIHDQV